MALFTLSDPHLSLSVEKPMDIFGGNWVNFEKKLMDFWTYAVTEEDTVVIPGDISWGMNLTEAEADLNFLEQLPGNKILMKGNHDYWWTSMTKMNAFLEEKGLKTIRFLHNDAIFTQGKIICGSRGWMCEDQMKEQDLKILKREAMRFALSLKQGKQLADAIESQHHFRPELICFSHYPIITQTQRENPILSVLEEFGVQRVYYGHLHNWGNKPLLEKWKQIEFTLVSADYRYFTPVRIED